LKKYRLKKRRMRISLVLGIGRRARNRNRFNQAIWGMGKKDQRKEMEIGDELIFVIFRAKI
jgi:hypothetical protein